MGRKTDPLKKAQNKSRKIEIKAKLASDALDREKFGVCQIEGCDHIARVTDDGMNVCLLHTKEAIAAYYASVEKGRVAWAQLQAMMGVMTEGQDNNEMLRTMRDLDKMDRKRNSSGYFPT